MKLLMYIFQEEPVFDSSDRYSLSMSDKAFKTLINSPTVYDKNRRALSLIKELLDTGSNKIPGGYFTPQEPLLYLIQLDDGVMKCYTKQGLMRYMSSIGETRIENDATMYVEIKDDKLTPYGVDVALSSSTLSDFIFVRTDERKSYRIYTGIDLNLKSGRVKVYGKAEGYVLNIQDKYKKIMDKLNTENKEYVTKVYYEYPTSLKFNIKLSEKAIFILDEVKTEVRDCDRERFGNLYSKAKSNKPIEAHYDMENFIYGIEVTKNGVSRIIKPEEATSSSYKDVNDKLAVVKIDGKFKLVEDYDKEAVKIGHRLEPTEYKEVKLTSNESFVIQVSNSEGIECKVAGMCKVPVVYKDVING